MSAIENALRKEIIHTVGLEKIKSFQEISVTRTITDSLIIYFGVFATYTIVAQLNYVGLKTVLMFFPFGALMMAVVFNWINVQVHEASHFLLFKSKQVNDLYCDIVLGGFAFYDVNAYRMTHQNHHTHLHAHQDPDLHLYIGHASKGSNIFMVLAGDILGITAFQKIKEVLEMGKKIKKNRTFYEKPVKVFCQLVLLSSFIFFTGKIGALYYLLFILIPLFCIWPILLRIRSIVQHFHQCLLSEKTPNNYWISRTTIANIFGRIIIGARMDFHFEHHVLPQIPYYNLKKLNKLLVNMGFFDESNQSDYLTKDFFTKSIKLTQDQIEG